MPGVTGTHVANSLHFGPTLWLIGNIGVSLTGTCRRCCRPPRWAAGLPRLPVWTGPALWPRSYRPCYPGHILAIPA